MCLFFSEPLGPGACQAAGHGLGVQDSVLGWGPWPDLALLSPQRKLYVSSQWEVSQVPLDLCSVYSGGCHGCLMARDPYCGWDQGHCVSIYSSQRYVGREPLSLESGWCR